MPSIFQPNKDGKIPILPWTILFAVILTPLMIATQAEEQAKKERVSPIDKCNEPVFLQAVGHSYSTGWVYGCADGSMIELPQPLPSAPIGNPDGWAGGR